MSIRRSEGSAISAAELRALVANDSTLREAESADSATVCNLEWTPEAGAKPVLFVFESGEVSATTPSNATLRKMQEIACLLGAKVTGEEGEDLTEVAVPDREFSPVVGISGCAIVVLLVAGALWWLLSR